MKTSLIRKRIILAGTVQGVGFRPFVYRLAGRHGLAGFVQNRTDGVVVEVEGPAASLEAFAEALRRDAPPLAILADLQIEDIPCQGETAFSILPSAADGDLDTGLPPDTATCPECLADLNDPENRRYRYPFTNCTACGPRLTIVADLPYDRGRTSMACFPLCPDCRAEYENPADRRFHAEPNACPVCGPRLTLLDADGAAVITDDPLRETIRRLAAGRILAVKGIGGYHLAVDAGNPEAVQRLRERKRREAKPLALMVRDVAAAEALAELSDLERRLLASPERPIVLARKRSGAPVAEACAPGLSAWGLLLPYAPLHHLLLEGPFTALVMTSGNVTDEPLCIGNREAVLRLAGIADFFLVHNRDILVRCDDSIARAAGGAARVLRRSRGYAPRPLTLPVSLPPVLALGPHLKATACIVRGRTAILSPHVGDLETPQARDFLTESIALAERLADCRPGIVACDIHPGYATSRLAETMANESPERAVIAVQHHHAHIVSCMADNGLTGEVLGLAMDGTGYGLDGTVWGGEFLRAGYADFSRLGRLRPFPLPGGEAAIREPWRSAVGLLSAASGHAWPSDAPPELLPAHVAPDVMLRQIAASINTVQTSSLGRLFDGVAAMLGLCRTAAFEGEAAMKLETLAGNRPGGILPYTIHDGLLAELDLFPAVAALLAAFRGGSAAEDLAAAFHATLARALADMAQRLARQTHLSRIALSGGCFQNRRLLEETLAELEGRGLDAFAHRHVPTNDGGISLGQAVCAGAITILQNGGETP